MFKKLLILLLIFGLSGCTKYWYKPLGRVFDQRPKGGSPGFNLGWDHGCQSGLGSHFGGAFMMTFYTWSKDPDIASVSPDLQKIRKKYRKELKDLNWNNEVEVKKSFSDYNRVFWSAHLFCRHVALGTLQTAGMGPNLAGSSKTPRYDPMAHSIGNIYKIDGKGDTRIAKGFW